MSNAGLRTGKKAGVKRAGGGQVREARATWGRAPGLLCGVRNAWLQGFKGKSSVAWIASEEPCAAKLKAQGRVQMQYRSRVQ